MGLCYSGVTFGASFQHHWCYSGVTFGASFRAPLVLPRRHLRRLLPSTTGATPASPSTPPSEHHWCYRFLQSIFLSFLQSIFLSFPLSIFLSFLQFLQFLHR